MTFLVSALFTCTKFCNFDTSKAINSSRGNSCLHSEYIFTLSAAASLKLEEVASGSVREDSTDTPAANGVVGAREGGGGEGKREGEEGEKKEATKEQWRQSLPEQDMNIETLESSPKGRRQLNSESEPL